MNRLTIRFPTDLYDDLQDLAAEEDIALADAVRQAVSHFLQCWQTQSTVPADAGSQREIEQLHGQAKTKDDQISELHQLLAVSQKSIQQLTHQNQLLLEDKRRPLWRRLLRR